MSGEIRVTDAEKGVATVERGWTVAVPGYDLTPDLRISAITGQAAAAIDAASRRINGPIHVCGHSVGGHPVNRMVCDDNPLADAIRQRLKRVVSISGLHDLRPPVKTAMNDVPGLDEAEAHAESAALNVIISGPRIVC